MGTRVDEFLNWIDPDKSTKHKIISTAISLSVGAVFGAGADAAPDSVKRATVEAIGYSIDKYSGSEIDKVMEEKSNVEA